MKISIEYFNDKFNISVHSAEGVDPFIVIKGCKIIEGSSGPFVSYPATKNESSGKWWNHVYGSDKFNEEVIRQATGGQSRAQAQAPRQAPARQAPRHDAARARQLESQQSMPRRQVPGMPTDFSDMDDDIPF